MSDTDEDFQLDLFNRKKLPIFKLSKEVPSDNSSSGDDMIKIKPKPNKITKTVGKIIPSFPVKKINDPMGKSPSVSATSIRAGLFGGQLESSVGGKLTRPKTAFTRRIVKRGAFRVCDSIYKRTESYIIR